MDASAAVRGLYVIVDPDAVGGRDPLWVASQALEGGARVLQWRDKRRDKGEQLPHVLALLELCRSHGALLVVNDHVDLALAAGAPAVHLGQKDLPVAVVRRFVAAEFILGVSTNNPEEARRAQDEGAGYVAVGALFRTSSKEVTRPASPQRLAEVKAAVSVPVVGIGGINASNVREAIAAGADAVAVISAVCGAADPRQAARDLARAFEERG